MKTINTYPELISLYIDLHKELMGKYLSLRATNDILIIFNDPEMAKKLRNFIEEQINNISKEIKVLNFLLKNERNLYYDDIMDIIDKFDENYKIRYEIYEDTFNNLNNAINMDIKEKFYIPVKKYATLTDSDVENEVLYAKGINLNRIKLFFYEHDILDFDEFDEFYQTIKLIDCNASENIDFFGIYYKGMILPKINDQYSALITINEMTRYALLKRRYEIGIDPTILLSEDIPIFYEHVFKRENKFIDGDIHTNSNVAKLLKTYKEEPFMEQINKLKKIK